MAGLGAFSDVAHRGIGKAKYPFMLLYNIRKRVGGGLILGLS